MPVLVIRCDVDAVQRVADNLFVDRGCWFVVFGTRLASGRCCLRLVHLDAVGEQASGVLRTKFVDERNDVLRAVPSYKLHRISL